MRRRVIWEKSLVRESPPRDGTRTEDYDRRESHPDLQALQGLRGLPAGDERRGDAGLTFAGVPPPDPGDALFLFPRRKSNQKCSQGARPLENPQFVVYLPSAVPGLILPAVPALRLPLPIVYPRVLTEAPAVAHRCGADLHGSDSEGPRC